MQAKVIKLTDANGQTLGGTQWGPNVTHTADGQSAELCNGHWLHAYRDVWIAAFCAPVHVFWWCEALAWNSAADVGLDNADKCGCTRVTTLRQVPLPKITKAQRYEIARRVALVVYPLWQKHDVTGVVGRWLQGDNGVLAEEASAAASSVAQASNNEGVQAAASLAQQCANLAKVWSLAPDDPVATWAAASVSAVTDADKTFLTWRRLSAIIRGVCGAAKRKTRRGKRGQVTR